MGLRWMMRFLKPSGLVGDAIDVNVISCLFPRSVKRTNSLRIRILWLTCLHHGSSVIYKWRGPNPLVPSSIWIFPESTEVQMSSAVSFPHSLDEQTCSEFNDEYFVANGAAGSDYRFWTELSWVWLWILYVPVIQPITWNVRRFHLLKTYHIQTYTTYYILYIILLGNMFRYSI